MSSNQKHSSLGRTLAISLGIACSAGAVHAGSIGDTYIAGDTLTAGKMTTIKNAVNDNDARITTNTSDITSLTGTVTTNTSNITSLTTTVNGHTTSIGTLTTSVANLQTGSGSCTGNNGSDVMVRVGSICVDKYEASLWTDKTSPGTSAAAGDCLTDGSNCAYVAQSRTGVLPTVSISLYQAAAACANAGKRLLTNAEWQVAALGTVAANCNTSSSTLANTDANSTCASRLAVVNMVGNAVEWVGDMTLADNVSGAAGLSGTTRGGDAGDFGAASVYYQDAAVVANTTDTLRGFRCAR